MSASDTPRKRIIFTGGTGKAGRHAIPYLLERGHEVTNLSPITGECVDCLVRNAGPKPMDPEPFEIGRAHV